MYIPLEKRILGVLRMRKTQILEVLIQRFLRQI